MWWRNGLAGLETPETHTKDKCLYPQKEGGPATIWLLLGLRLETAVNPDLGVELLLTNQEAPGADTAKSLDLKAGEVEKNSLVMIHKVHR